MRLTHIKLAGFKSFVDPTHIPVPGKLVGVVGPNGCGKSNVIDAVRWVLGETSAKQLRGDNMQDVIFAGSVDRKPTSRASVELIFDNTAGKLTGPWAQYSEISVKRVLEREGTSSYYLNNQHVRRRDVADIFLGTGLGGKGYAIIEQGMISRIIEARPDDMRSFLEEAAGVSKYRERRRETELRLQDTRENLSRVEDIQSELNKQLQKLEKQAQQAEKFHEYERELKETQHSVWFFGRRDAEKTRALYETKITHTKNEIEEKIANLRKTEAEIETLKIARDESSKATNEVQGTLYEVNSTISRVEQTIEHLRDTRKRTQQQLRSIHSNREQERSNLQHFEQEFWNARAHILDVRAEQTQNLHHLNEANKALPALEEDFLSAELEVNTQKELISDVQNQLSLNKTHQKHSADMLSQLLSRKERLDAERLDLTPADAIKIESMDSSIQRLNHAVSEHAETLSRMDSDLANVEKEKDAAGDLLDEHKKAYSVYDAKKRALTDLQSRVSQSDRMKEWLESGGFSSKERLWELIRVAEGWEDAVESVLRERLMSIATNDLDAITFADSNKPPSKISFFHKNFEYSRRKKDQSGRRSLASVIDTSDQVIKSLMDGWLSHVLIAESDIEARRLVDQLSPGEMCITQRGDLYYPGGIALFAADQEVHGVLARQLEIEKLDHLVLSSKKDLDDSSEKFQMLFAAVSDAKVALGDSRERYVELKETLHQERVDYLRLSDLNQRTIERLAQIDTELLEIVGLQKGESLRHQDASAQIEAMQIKLVSASTSLENMMSTLQSTNDMRNKKLKLISGLNEKHSETSFEYRTLSNKIIGLSENIKNIYQMFIRMDEECDELTSQLNQESDGMQSEELQQNLIRRGEIELSLSSARETLSGWEQRLKQAELQRQKTEQAVQPLRETVNTMNLSEQEHRLARDAFSQQLAESDAEEERLLVIVTEHFDVESATDSINTLQNRITRLGAINLAALEELTESKERKGYLDSQAEDLLKAVSTLESAIRSIDKETRERLSETFEQVNNQFAEMFPALFGGGEAKLVLTGEEILDAGVEVVARPPGKRNTSIHLLSGGEKALTALSLVFSLFQLNPAPFCLLDEVDAPLDDSNTVRYCDLVKKMSQNTQFLFITHNKITMEMGEQLIGVTMQEQGVSRVVAVDIEEAMKLNEEAVV